jgi:hypothetical protein
VGKLHLFVAICAAAILVVAGSTAIASRPGDDPCVNGVIPAGTYAGFTLNENCTFGPGTVQINGDLVVADGVILNDHAGSLATVHVTGDVRVGRGSVLGLGQYRAPGVKNATTVDGNIVANQALDLYLGGMTVHGNVISNGGGPGPSGTFRNLPLKDDTIDGNLIVHGWQGGWWGIIRDTVGGNVDVSGNVSVLTDDGSPPPDTDSSEVMTNTISGNLVCHNNTPAAQVNPDDGGQPNTVEGNAVGECAGLTT